MAARQLRKPFFRTPCQVTIDDTVYKLKHKVDNGSFGQVYVAHKLHQEHELVAIKIMSHERIKKKQQQKRIQEEINLHSQIQINNIHWIYPNKAGIVELYSFDHNVEIKNKLYECMVMEYCEGSHLNQYLRSHPSDRLTEIESFYFFQQIIRSLECLHQQHVIHRDIKPQNLLLKYDKHSLPILKLCDFGLAKKLSLSTATTHSMCGTPNYVAPEIVNSEGHGYAADVWSAGIVLYIMLVKHHQPPFETGNIQLTMAKVRDENVIIPQYLSNECKSFLSLIFIKKKSKRITIKKLKQHIWWKYNRNKLNILLKRGLNHIDTNNLKEYKKCFKKTGCIYEINDGSAKLLWGGQNCDDYCLEVMQNKEINVVFGGISTQNYNINTLPIGFYLKYMMLQRFVSIQIQNTPLIAVSIINRNDEININAFNYNHYAILLQSKDIVYYHSHCKTKIFIQYNKYRNECNGYYENWETNEQISFNVMETNLYKNDILLFHTLKTELFGDLSQKYILKKNNAFKYPVILKYISNLNNVARDKQFMFGIK